MLCSRTFFTCQGKAVRAIWTGTGSVSLVISTTAFNIVFGTEVLKEGIDQLNKITAATTTRLIIRGVNVAAHSRIRVEVFREIS